MEIFSELILTISLSLIFASFFIKLVSMQTNNTSNDNDTNNDKLSEEVQMIDKFKHTPFKEEVIKFEECPNEGKSSVELYNVVGVNKEYCEFQDVEVVDSNKEGKTEGNDDDDNNNDEENTRFGSEEENGGERKSCEIEIESEEEEGEEREIGIMDDWEEIGRKDFEELLGNKAGFYNVEIDYEK